MIEFNKKSENPFTGLKNCLKIFNGGINNVILDAAYDEVKSDKNKREMFYSLLFSIGDITNRQHNIFKNKTVDNGGRSERDAFYHIMDWLRVKDYNQFLKFLWAGLFNEYTCFDNLFANRVQTIPGTTNIKNVYKTLDSLKYRNDLADYVVSIIKGTNPFNKMLVAKFLTLPRLGKRKNHYRMLQETYWNMKAKADFIRDISTRMHWACEYNGNYFNPIGYRMWRKQYNGNLESVLFSTGKINEFDELQFKDWLEKLPAGARSRIKKRLYCSFKEPNNPKSGLKWEKLYKWLTEWEDFKEKAQNEQRKLTEKVRQNTATIEELARLEEVKKEAKVNVGATNFPTLYEEILNGSIDKLKLEAFTNKINLPFDFLTIIDDSGSMTGAPFNLACFLATVFLSKNPDDTARQLVAMFSTNCRFYYGIDKIAEKRTSFWHNPTVTKVEPSPLIDPNLSFYDNYKKLSGFLNAEMQGCGTYPESIGRKLIELAETNPDTIDEIKRFPVWVICSDGDFSSGGKEAIVKLQNICKDNLGFVPYIVLVEVRNFNNYDIKQFAGVDNFMYIPGKPELVEQMLTNFKDIDVMDIYAPLQSLYRSNRYEIVRENVI